jgi:hypothetical protein
MGTSTSSSGPGAGVSFDPPWLDQLGGSDAGGNDAQAPAGDSGEAGDGNNAPAQSAAPAAGIAPPRRFANARRELGIFARSGSREALGRAIGHYSRTGMGGARNTAARMRTSTRSAAGLISLLQAARDGSDPIINQWVSSLVARNPSAQDVINEVIQQVTTSGGSLEEESCKDSMAQAMSELMENQPDIDLLNMNDGDIWTLVELFLSHEACSRLQLDIGQLFESSRLTPREVVARINDMRDYLKAELSAQMRSLRQANGNPLPGQLESTMRQALQNTFTVYEGAI